MLRISSSCALKNEVPALIYINIYIYLEYIGIREAEKKTLFLVAWPLRPYPNPLELSGHIFWEFILEIQKSFFFLVAMPSMGGKFAEKKIFSYV